MTTPLPSDWTDKTEVHRWVTDQYGYEPTYHGAIQAVMIAAAAQSGKLRVENEKLRARMRDIHQNTNDRASLNAEQMRWKLQVIHDRSA